MKKRLLSFFLALTLLLPAVYAQGLSPSTADLDQQMETEHFVFHYSVKEANAPKVLSDLKKSFEGCYGRVTTALKQVPAGKSDVYLYPDISSYHTAFSWQNLPSSSVGQYYNGAVYMASPANPGTEHTYSDCITIAVHEFVHLVIDLFGRRQPTYLNEGLASYMAGQTGSLYYVREDVRAKRPLSLSEVEAIASFDGGRLYGYGHAYVDFIVKNFGNDAIIGLLEGQDRETLLGQTAERLNQRWLTYLEKEYGDRPPVIPDDNPPSVPDGNPPPIPDDDTPPAPVGFTDVPDGTYYTDAVAWAVDRGITAGTTATTFTPGGNCTRAQIVTFLWRANGSPKVSGDMPFTDLKPGAYYYDAAQWAVVQGITKGTSATTFSPNTVCTRAQAVAFLHRGAGSPASSVNVAFSDVAGSSYYADAVAWAVENEITAGTSATTFSPNEICSRAQIVTFLYRSFT